MGEAAAGQSTSCAGGKWVFRRREPKRSPLYAAVCENLGALLGEAVTLGRGLPQYVAGTSSSTWGVKGTTAGGLVTSPAVFGQ